MELVDWFVIGSIIAACLTYMFIGVQCCCFSVTSSVAPGKRQRAAAGAGLAFDTCTRKEGADGGCAICLGEYLAGERRATISDCEHRFHAVCIEKWIKLNCTCPLCRHNLV